MHETIVRAVERSIETMREHLDEKLTVDDLARSAMFSRFHFSRVFQRATGVSPRRFLSAMRLEEAKRLLLATSIMVVDIGHQVGYDSVGTFSSRFRSSVGVSRSPTGNCAVCCPVFRRTTGRYQSPKPAPCVAGCTARRPASSVRYLLDCFPVVFRKARRSVTRCCRNLDRTCCRTCRRAPGTSRHTRCRTPSPARCVTWAATAPSPPGRTQQRGWPTFNFDRSPSWIRRSCWPSPISVHRWNSTSPSDLSGWSFPLPFRCAIMHRSRQDNGRTTR